MRRMIFAVCAIVLILNAPASAEMYKIDNPAGKIHNPADKMYNPATQENNPSSNIYNPSTRLNAKNPLSPPTQPVSQPTVKEASTAKKPVLQKNKKQQSQSESTTISKKRYNFKHVREYMNAANKSFAQENYGEFLSITEDALRRINAGTLKASKKTKKKLITYKKIGYGLLNSRP